MRAVAILKSFDDDNSEWSLSQLAKSLNMNKTTVFRLLSALESEGLIARSSTGENYVLGTEIVTMAGYALRSNNLRTMARPALKNLAAATHETASLEVLSGEEMLIIDEIPGEHLVAGIRSLGTQWPIHGSSTGLAILAAWPENKRESFLLRELESITAFTVTSSQDLRGLLDQFAQQGFAVSDEMLEPGLVAIGAPLINYDGHVEAAISIYGPKNRLHGARIQEIGELVRQAGEDISTKLGYRPFSLD